MSEKCAKFVQTYSRKLPPIFVRELCRTNFAQSRHIFDAHAHVSHKFSGTSQDYPAYKFCTIFSDTWHVLKICLCTGKSCLKPRTLELMLSRFDCLGHEVQQSLPWKSAIHLFSIHMFVRPLRPEMHFVFLVLNTLQSAPKRSWKIRTRICTQTPHEGTHRLHSMYIYLHACM